MTPQLSDPVPSPVVLSLEEKVQAVIECEAVHPAGRAAEVIAVVAAQIEAWADDHDGNGPHDDPEGVCAICTEVIAYSEIADRLRGGSR